jgi:iron complex outermembrane receptor protein
MRRIFGLKKWASVDGRYRGAGSVAGKRFIASIASGVIAAGLIETANAQTADAGVVELPTIEVVATSPLGAAAPADKIPARTQTVTSRDISRAPQPDVVRALEQRVPGVTVNNISGNDFQPEVEFRGFSASPVPGVQQGLAVYQNGVRINEPFGDVVNWDLIPSNAIDQTSIVTNNPAFGLNALGGALTLTMKNGFTFKGFESDVRVGSFGRRQAGIQYGIEVGPWSTYVAAEAISDGGWRQGGGSEIRRAFGDLGWRANGGEIHLNVSHALNRFGAAATTPVELLANNWGAVYTTPQSTRNEATAVNLSASWDVASTLKLAGNLYFRSFDQRHVDGNVADTEACSKKPANPLFGFLCLQNDSFPSGSPTALFALRDPAGNPIPISALGGGIAGSLDRTHTNTLSWGGSLQATHEDKFAGFNNRLVTGVSLDMSRVDFSAASELGIIQPDLSVAGTGIQYHTLVNGGVSAVGLGVRNSYVGVYALDTIDLTERWSATIGGRYNSASIDLRDQLGTALNGSYTFARFNPVAGMTYKLTPELTAYAGYSEANRAPTPLELGCADPAAPCLIDNFLTSDPPLKQVVSRTVEAGLRGQHDAFGGKLTWSAGVFSTDNENDIIAAPSAIAGRGFFTNAGRTRRRGVELDAGYRLDDWSVYAAYGFVDATFLTTMTLPSPNNPAADINGNILVSPGSRIPGVPQHRLKAGFDWSVTPRWKVGANAILISGFYLRGDEGNANPQQPGYAIVNLTTSFKLTEQFEIYGLVNNLFDRRYATAGGYFDTAALPALAFTDPRSLAPAAPRAFYVGMKARF